MVPNDDLDLQVVWLERIRRTGLPVDRRTLADAWLEHAHFWPDEYGVALGNLSRGILPPASGLFDNAFTAGMGAAIRSEIWACCAPGDPELAASLAREDACVDHAGEGLHAAVYLAALQSAAFTCSDVGTLLDGAAATIPSHCRVAQAISEARSAWAESADWKAARERILAGHGRQNFTDVAQNLAFIVLGLLAGEGDFGRSICTAVNCGCDTDCTGATLGALLGIMQPEGISERWLAPIGRDLVLSPSMVGMHHAKTLDEFTDRVAGLAVAVLGYYRSATCIESVPGSIAELGPAVPPRTKRPDSVALDTTGAGWNALVCSTPLAVALRYPEGAAVAPGEAGEFVLTAANTSEIRCAGKATLVVPEGWSVCPASAALDLAPGGSLSLALTVMAPAMSLRPCRNPLDVRFDVNGMCWTASADVPLTTPWLRWRVPDLPDRAPLMPPDAERVEAAGRFQPLPEGARVYKGLFKLSREKTVSVIVQAQRRVRVWLDDETLFEHDGTYLVPAVHRSGPTAGQRFLRRGEHELTIAVGADITSTEPCHGAGKLFVGVGDRETWEWLTDLEWLTP